MGEELGECAFAGAEVCNVLVVQGFDEGFGEGLPGSAGDVVLTEAAGEFIEVGPGGVLAFPEDVVEGSLIV